MLLPDVDLDTWLKKYSLVVLVYICPKCTMTFQTNVPIVMKGAAGVMSPIHECGRRYKRLVLSPTIDPSLWEAVAPIGGSDA